MQIIINLEYSLGEGKAVINKSLSGYSTLVQFQSGTRNFVLFTQTSI